MTAYLWIRQVWVDAYLSWDKEEYGGIDSIQIPSSYVWRPDIVLYNKWVAKDGGRGVGGDSLRRSRNDPGECKAQRCGGWASEAGQGGSPTATWVLPWQGCSEDKTFCISTLRKDTLQRHEVSVS